MVSATSSLLCSPHPAHHRQGLYEALLVYSRRAFQCLEDSGEPSELFQELGKSAHDLDLRNDKLTKLDMLFSILVVKLSMINPNSSSVISSRTAGPRYAGGFCLASAIPNTLLTS